MFVPAVASAETLEVDRFEPTYDFELLGLQGIDTDTGWQPSGSAIQVRFLTHADDDVAIEMPGDAVFDWDTGQVHFVGDEDGGAFDVDIGVLLEGRFRFDLVGQQFESSLIGPYELGIFREATFTPYLLPGNDDRPVVLDDVTTPVEVFNYAIVDLLIASGNFFVDASFDIEMTLACDRIDVEGGSAQVGTIQAEFEVLTIADPEEDPVERLASLHCTMHSDLDLLLYPGVELQIAFQEFQLAPFELRVPLVEDQTDAVDFESLPIVFDTPPEQDPTGTTGEVGDSSGADADSSGGAGHSGSGSESGDGFGTSRMTGDLPETETDTDTDTEGGGAGADSAAGCGCTSGSDPGAALFLLGLLAIGPTRRDRRSSRPARRRARAARASDCDPRRVGPRPSARRSPRG